MSLLTPHTARRCYCRLFSFVLALLAFGYSRAQQSLTILPPQTATCTPEGSFVCQATLINKGADTVRFTQQPFNSTFFMQLGGQGRTYKVAPGDSLRLNLRFLNKYGRINGNYQLAVVLQLADDTQLPVLFPVELKNGMEARVFAEVLQERIQVMPLTQQVTVPVRMRSFLPAGTVVTLVFAEPHPTLQLLQPELQVQLPQMRDTLIMVPLVRVPLRKEEAPADRPITVRIKGSGGRILTSFNFLPQMLATARAMFTPDGPAAGLRAGMSAGMLHGGQLMQEFSLAYQPALPTDPFAFQLNYIQFGQTNFRQLSGSWMQLRSRSSAVRVGSITDFHELNLQGRGVAANTSLPGQHLHANVWLVDNNMNLLTPLESGVGEQIASSQLTYDGFKGGDLVVNGSWFRRRNSFSEGNLQFAEWRSKGDAASSINLRLGTSEERFGRLDTTLRGYAALVEGRSRFWGINWFGRYAHTAPAYAGNQRGLVNGMVQASLAKTKGYSLGFRWNLFGTRTTPALSRMLGLQELTMQTAEVDAGFVVWKTNVNIKPYFLTQQQQLPLLIGAQSLQSHAFNTSILLNRHIGALGVGLSWDGGLQQKVQANKALNSTLAWRSGANISWGKLSVAAFMQQGGYFLSEQQAAVASGDQFRNLTLSGGYGTPIGKNWSVQTSATGTFNSLFNFWQYGASQEIQWTKAGWHAIGSMMYFGGRSSMLQVRAGVQRTFSIQPQRRSLFKVQVRVFEDHNSNGLREDTEPWLADQLVQADDLLMITNSQGSFRLSNVASGTHRFQVLSKGLTTSVLVARSVELTGATTLNLGIPPMYTVLGKVVSREDRFTGKSESVGNVRVTLSGSDGEQITFTRPDGSFAFKTPAGSYTVFITQLRNSGRPNTSAVVSVTPGQGFTGKLELVWTAGERPVQVKKVKIE